MTLTTQQAQWVHSFDIAAAVVARTTIGKSLWSVASASSDCFVGEGTMRAVESGARVKGLYDISSIALSRMGLEEGSVLDVLARSATNCKLGSPTFFDNVEHKGLKEVIATSSATLPQEAAKQGQRDVVGRAVLDCIRTASNSVAISTLLKKAVLRVRSSGSTPSAILEDLVKVITALAVSTGSKLFLIVDPITATRLALKTIDTGALAFPGLSINGGDINATVQVVVVGADEMPPIEGGSRCAVVVDAAGLLIDPGKVGLGRKEISTTGGADETILEMEALRIFGLDQFRPSVALIEGVHW